MTDYKKYSLGQLENFLYDAMSAAEATPQEIYDVIVGVVKDNYYTYKKQASESYELLALLNGNGVGHISDYDDTELMPNLQYTDEELDAMCAAAANDEEYLISKGYFKDNGFWTKPKDKVVKWILPVEDDGIIIFPDDLLEAVDLKEGDQFEWHNQGNGSFKMIKVTKKEN